MELSLDDRTIQRKIDNLEQQVEGLQLELSKSREKITEYESKGERAVSRSLKASLMKSKKRLDVKNEELNQFIYAASHDLLEPVNTILSAIDVIKEGGLDAPEIDPGVFLDFIKNSSDQLKGLISDLLAFSLIGRNPLEEYIDLNQVMSVIRKENADLIRDCNASLRAAPMPILKGDRGEIQQLFSYIISNALKFRDTSRRTIIEVSCSSNKDFWTFKIKDNGIGIPDQFKHKVFELFCRLNSRESYGGSGIGLSHCWKIVNVHGGKIWVDDNKAGTTICFTLSK